MTGDTDVSKTRAPEAEPPGGVRDPDLEIWVESSGSPLPVLEFWLSDAQQGRIRESFGTAQLRSEPQTYFEDFFRKIKGSVLQGRGTAEHLAKKGAQLAELLPENLLRHLWQRRHDAASLRIQSQEVWIPWELLKLEGQDEDGRWSEGPFLCEAFALTRWQDEISPKLNLPLSHLGVVAPVASNLVATSEEVDFLLEQASPKRRVDRIPARRREVLEAWARGDLDGLHFSGHGITPPGDPDDWAIVLEDGDLLTPARLYGEARNLGRLQPLVFLNACHTGRGAMSLSHLGGWASKLLDVGAGAFIGTSWPVKDRAALRFAVHFYRGFLGGLPIGEAVRSARLSIRREFPEDASWLAYTVFAHPLARCQPRSPTGAEPVDAPDFKDRGRGMAWRAAGLAIGLLTGLFFSMLRAPTWVQLDLIVDRVALTVAGDRQPAQDGKPAQSGQPVARTAPLPWQRLTLSGFDRLELSGSASTSGVQEASGPGPLTVTPRSPASRVRLLAVGDESEGVASLGTLGPLELPPGVEIELRSRPASEGAIALDMSWSLERLAIAISSVFELQVESADLKDSGLRLLEGETPIHGQGPLMAFAANEGLEISLQASASPVWSLLDADLPIAAVRLGEDSTGGQQSSGLKGDGELTYPGQRLDAVALRDGDFLKLEGLHEFKIRDLRIDASTDLLRLLLEGRAGRVLLGGANEPPRERTLFWFQRLPGWVWIWWAGWLGICVFVAHALERTWRGRSYEVE